jgi:hypothetical protein
MADTKNCSTPRAGPVTRPHWKAGSHLTAAACSLQQSYLLGRLRRHNRDLHGWGVLCGLWVIPAADATRPWAVKICPGYALGPYGDEIELPIAVEVDIQGFLWYRSLTFSTVSFRQFAYIAVRYQEWSDGLEAVPGAACTCPPPDYVEARTGDGYQAGVIWNPPVAIQTPGICVPGSPACPPCPDSPWVTLARVALPRAGSPLTAAMIDNGIRITL